MAEQEVMKCSSCGKRIESEQFWVRFSCPSCGKGSVIRCEKCKTMENKYACASCKFKGP